MDILRLHALYVSAGRNLCPSLCGVSCYCMRRQPCQSGKPCYISVRHSSVMYSASNPKDNNVTSANVFVLQFNGFMSLTSYFDVKYRY